MMAANQRAMPRAIENDFAAAVLEGLSKPRKILPSRLFYDARGSALFEEITRLPEYYPARTEQGILTAHAQDIVAQFASGCVLVEFGSGSSLKTEILLAATNRISAYVAIDVSNDALREAKDRLEKRFPRLDVRTFVGDFNEAPALPRDLAEKQKAGFFPGSTIGNLVPAAAAKLLDTFRRMIGRDGRLVVGIDLKKNVRTLVDAYDDASGVTASFNLNILARINRELASSFDLGQFRHKALYNPREGRIEMHLVSNAKQDVDVCGQCISFKKGESIHTENSYKYTVREFQDLARIAGWTPRDVWTDDANLFSVHVLG